MGFSGERLALVPLSYLKVANSAETAEPLSSQRVVVFGYCISVTEEQEVKLTDGTTTLVLNAAKSGGASYAGGPHCPAWEFAKGKKVKVEGSTADGHLTYVIV